METKDIQEAVKRAREGSKKRNFSQTFDLAISMRDLDMKNPAHKVKAEVPLPFGVGKARKVGAIAEGELAEKARNEGLSIISKADLQSYVEDKKAAKKIVNSVDMFIAQPDLMVDVGKTLGPILGPRDKMPKPVPPQAELKSVLAGLSKIVTVRVKDQPVMHARVGTEEMKDEEITANVDKILKAVVEKLPKGEHNIRGIYLKLTMGKSFKIGAEAPAEPAKGKAETPKEEVKTK